MKEKLIENNVRVNHETEIIQNIIDLCIYSQIQMEANKIFTGITLMLLVLERTLGGISSMMLWKR